ncbi:DUF418 domain-containing protein [Qipengyuania vesicularis]|uniref:DUF418 domain-containing protein n=1 Tax=Qipengyuania vesicularis TaxID=2867232 RepID=UPI001FFD2DBC|nr:DUF418 domain-containing protein [Qipengyuania vesicularis]
MDDSRIAAQECPRPAALEGGRIASLDFIRGIAVMGILVANIMSIGQPHPAYGYPGAFTTGHSPSEDWMWVAQFILVDGKMRGLFAILFGAGLWLFLEKAWEKGATRMLQVRRLLWLGLFGLIHFYFVWRGDILFAYAFSGVVAVFLLLDLSPKQQIGLAMVGYVSGAIYFGSTMGFVQSVVDGPPPDSAALQQVRAEFIAGAEADLADGQDEAAILQDGSYWDFVGHNFEWHAWDPTIEFTEFPFEILPLVLLGIALFRLGLFTGDWSPSRLRRWGGSLLMVGAIPTAWIALATKAGGYTYYGTYAALVGWSHLPRLAMTLGFLFLLVLWAPRAGGWLGKRVEAAGRAAFTNYLGTSIVMLLVFGNWGLDLFGRLGRSELYLVVLLAWSIMLGWSKPWLDRFRYGPLEWLWRCLTYGRMFALRR